MSKFSQIARGLDQVDEVALELPGLAEPVRLGVRPLLASDDEEILAEARKAAVARGVADPADGNAIYDLALAVQTLVRACVDIESADKRAPFFDGGAAQIRTLDRDRIAYLYERQQFWQDQCAPLPKKMGAEAFLSKVLEIAGTGDEDESPFVSLRHALLRSFTRTLVRQHMALAMHKSPSGLVFLEPTEGATKSSEGA